MARDIPVFPDTLPPDQGRFRLDQVLTLSGGHFIHDSFTAFLNPLLPLIVEKLSLTLTAAGSLTLFLRLPSLLNPFIGLWADRIDLRLLVVLAPAGTAVAMSLIGLAPSYAVLAFLLLLAGLCSAALHVPGPVITSRVSGRQVGTGMSLWMMGGELARSVGPLVAVWVVAKLTLDGYYPVMLVGILTSVLLFFRFKSLTLPPQGHSKPAPLGETWRALRRLMLPFAGIMLFRSFMRSATSTFLPIFIISTGEDLVVGGWALAVVEFAGALGALAAGSLSDLVGRRRVLLVALLFSPLLMLCYLLVESGGGILPFVILALVGFATLSTTPVIMAMVQDYGRDYPATANGIYMGISFLISAVGAPVVGWMGDQIGLQQAFFWSAILSIPAVPLVFLLPKEANSAHK